MSNKSTLQASIDYWLRYKCAICISLSVLACRYKTVRYCCSWQLWFCGHLDTFLEKSRQFSSGQWIRGHRKWDGSVYSDMKHTDSCRDVLFMSPSVINWLSETDLVLRSHYLDITVIKLNSCEQCIGTFAKYGCIEHNVVRPSYMPHYVSGPSVRLSVCCLSARAPSAPNWKTKERKRLELVWTFLRPVVTGMLIPIFKSQRSRFPTVKNLEMTHAIAACEVTEFTVNAWHAQRLNDRPHMMSALAPISVLAPTVQLPEATESTDHVWQ